MTDQTEDPAYALLREAHARVLARAAELERNPSMLKTRTVEVTHGSFGRDGLSVGYRTRMSAPMPMQTKGDALRQAAQEVLGPHAEYRVVDTVGGGAVLAIVRLA